MGLVDLSTKLFYTSGQSHLAFFEEDLTQKRKDAEDHKGKKNTTEVWYTSYTLEFHGNKKKIYIKTPCYSIYSFPLTFRQKWFIIKMSLKGSPLDEAALWPHLPTPGLEKAGLFFAYNCS